MSKTTFKLSNGFPSNSTRPVLEIDYIKDDGTALDTVRKRPSYRTKTFKKVSKKMAELEEWVDFVQSKSKVD